MAIVSGSIAASGLVALVWTAVSHYREYGHLAINMYATILAVTGGTICFVSARNQWREAKKHGK